MSQKKDNEIKKVAKAAKTAAGKVARKAAARGPAATPQRPGKLPKKNNTGLPRKEKKAAGKAAAAKQAKAKTKA